MLTRIRYNTSLKGKIWNSPRIPISSKLIVYVYIIKLESHFEMNILDCNGGKPHNTENCKTLATAKRKARKKLEELGLNFNNEIRRKK